MAKTILIKKYENRRLYDATNSRYVNLEDVARILQHGDDVRVVDAASGDDITRLILTQIIVEGAKARDSSFPLDILRDMVVASGRAGQESAVRYTRAMLDLYKSAFQAMSPALNPFEFMQSANAAKSQEAPSSAAEPAPERKAAPNRDEVTGLKQRVAELERLVASLPAAQQTSREPARKSRRPAGRK